MRPIVAGNDSRIRLIHRYRRDLAVALARKAAIERAVVALPSGPLEFAERGSGLPVLAAHGILGDFQAGIWTVNHVFGGSGFRVIAPSRFGYLGTPMPSGATPAKQADAFVELLDHLEVDRAIVVGFSAGGTSAIEFGFRHPDRTMALILASPNVPGPHLGRLPKAMKPVFRADILWWLLRVFLPGSLTHAMGVPKGFELTPEDEEAVADIADAQWPVRGREEGVIFDAYVSNPTINQPFGYSDMSAPTLIVHARDDRLAPYEGAPRLARRIPGARLVSLERGGHLGLGGAEEQLRAAVAAFLQEHQIVEGRSALR